MSIRLFAIYNLLSIIVGGLLASILMHPELEAGPVRLLTYITFFAASSMLASKYLRIVRKNDDGMANLFVVASCYWWITFAFTSVVILYLITARAFDLWPHWGENFTERISYFFISGAAVGVLYKAITFQFIPADWLIDRRVPAWPLTIGKRRRRFP